MSRTSTNGTRATVGPARGWAVVVTRRPRRRWPRITAVAVVAGLLVAALVLGVTALLPESWEGRVGLLASPVGSAGAAALNRSGVSASYGEVVALAMPSIGDLVTSPSVLDAVVAAVPGSPSAEDLASRVGVEVLAGSGVARISVAADTSESATRLAEAIGQRAIAANLLAPSGRLRLLDPRASVSRTTPDWPLAAGIGLILGLVAGLATVLLMRPFRPRVPAGPAVVQAVTATGRPPVRAFHVDDPTMLERVGVLARAADRPVRVLAAGPGVDDAVRSLSSELAGTAAAPYVGDDSVIPAVVVVLDRDDVRGDDVRAALAALPAGELLLAVVLV